MSGLEPDPDLLAWLALRRVHSGGVANVAGRWLDGGRRVPSYLPDTLDELTGAGLVALADDGPHGPLRRASLTEDGRVRYGVLQRHDRPGTTPATGPTLHWARDPCDGHLHQSSVLVCSPKTAR